VAPSGVAYCRASCACIPCSALPSRAPVLLGVQALRGLALVRSRPHRPLWRGFGFRVRAVMPLAHFSRTRSPVFRRTVWSWLVCACCLALRSQNARCGHQALPVAAEAAVWPRTWSGFRFPSGWRTRESGNELASSEEQLAGCGTHMHGRRGFVALSTLCGFVPPGHPLAGGFPVVPLRRPDRAHGPGRRCVSRLTGRG